MMVQRFLLDSGAFSVWNRGESIDLDDYIRFCDQNDWCSYYVNLDIIPGRPNDPKSMTPDAVQSACRGGWANYRKMIRTLPFDKVVPVFHQGDSFDWLEKYLNLGTPYIGISPANDKNTDQRLVWLSEVKKHILDSAGNLIIKTHGFAVTSFVLMKFMPWHSVDSASWIRAASYGTVYIPHFRGGEWVYNQAPFLLSFSPKSPNREERLAHITTLSPTIKKMVDDYLKVLNMKVGESEVVSVGEGYKLQEDELWFEKGKKDKILKKVTQGLSTNHQQRIWANMKFMQKANDALDTVDHIYFAGAEGSLMPQIEFRLKRRLMSYHSVKESKAKAELFAEYERRFREVAVAS